MCHCGVFRPCVCHLVQAHREEIKALVLGNLLSANWPKFLTLQKFTSLSEGWLGTDNCTHQLRSKLDWEQFLPHTELIAKKKSSKAALSFLVKEEPNDCSGPFIQFNLGWDEFINRLYSREPEANIKGGANWRSKQMILLHFLHRTLPFFFFFWQLGRKSDSRKKISDFLQSSLYSWLQALKVFLFHFSSSLTFHVLWEASTSVFVSDNLGRSCNEFSRQQ